MPANDDVEKKCARANALACHADFYMKTSWVVDLAGRNFTLKSDLTKDDLAKNFWAPQLGFINAREEATRLVEEPFAFAAKLPSAIEYTPLGLCIFESSCL